jgi:hypothetical protein
MFLLNGKVIQPGVAFTDANGIQYPPQWLYQTTLAQKQAIGITEVPDPIPVDNRFYWDTNLPKEINDTVDINEDGSNRVNKGLKSQFIDQVKDTANKLLAQTDWTVIRKAERNVDIPADIVAKRAKILDEATRLETAITGVTNVEELIQVLNNQDWEAK